MGGRPGSGLSGSSALVCAATLAVLAAAGARPAKAVSLAALGHTYRGHSQALRGGRCCECAVMTGLAADREAVCTSCCRQQCSDCTQIPRLMMDSCEATRYDPRVLQGRFCAWQMWSAPFQL